MTKAAPPSTRKRNGSLTALDEFQDDIKSRIDGRKFLEKLSLLCPPGDPTTYGALSILDSSCRYYVQNTQPTAQCHKVNGTPPVEKIEEEAINLNETVRSAFDSQITGFTSDMKLLVAGRRQHEN